jgi:hypothetical protein
MTARPASSRGCASRNAITRGYLYAATVAFAMFGSAFTIASAPAPSSVSAASAAGASGCPTHASGLTVRSVALPARSSDVTGSPGGAT